uniref:Solute carrier family 45 member 4 n=1 Tax=Lates calcarifer TaxID=8187 RepID=A0A4W6C9F1_LATCA
KTDGSGGGGGGGGGGRGGEESASEGSIEGIPVKRWVMHGAVMFGREFCYAMETALVTPVLLQIGLPEQYYSLTWFLSPVLGLMFTPLIGSASDRCTLRWGRRRPFILALCIGTLIGVALFLNGSLIGEYGRQPIGIVLTVLGVVVLDFCADATEGPIRAYLLDVADTEEQDMALNIHAASAGLGGAVGYALGGLDWTHTFLGKVFKSQEQILFFFAAILFSISVALHLLSIEEQQYSPQHDSTPPPRLANIRRSSSTGSQDLLRPQNSNHQTHMPPELLRLCACHLLTWFSIIAEAVFFTDFMGQVIYHGDPTAPANSTLLDNYHRGVQMGCWGLVIYAMTAATCSEQNEDKYEQLKSNFGTDLVFPSVGTAIMAIFPNVYVAMVMISSMGIISMSISYCPYALLGQYHEMKEYIQHSPGNSRRGFGIDCAILSCQVYISQILVASALGAVVEAVGSVRVIPMVASGGSLLGFFTACFLVIYPSPNNG